MTWRSGRAYSQDLRDRVLAAVDSGTSVYAATEHFNVTPSYIYKALMRRRLTGDSGPNPNRGHNPRKLFVEQEMALADHMRANRVSPWPVAGLAGSGTYGLVIHGCALECSSSAWSVIQKKALRAAEQDRPDVAARRRMWCAVQPYIDPECLVFLDETGVNTKMARLYGWSPVGERCRDSVPYGHWKTMTFIAGLRLSGLTAPWVLDGPMNGDAFRVYVERVLGPTLQPGDIVVLDNLPAHKVAGIKQAINARGAQLFYLPPYSPDLSPIEMAFSKLKALMRQKPARTIDTLINQIADLLNEFKTVECQNFFTAAGYQRST